MTVGFGCDHAGFALKEELKPFVEGLGYEVKDYGTFSAEAVDYPKFGFAIGRAVAAVPGVRAALCHDTFSAHSSREHNDANILAIGARVIGTELAKEIVKTWLAAEFLGGRHLRRVQMLEEGRH